MRVPVLSAKPKSYQPENWLLDPNFYWERAGRATWEDLAMLKDDPPLLWANGHSSYNGLHDRVPLSMAEGFGCSLYLLHVRDLKLGVFAPGSAFGNPKRRVQAKFTHRGIRYALWVTDPDFEREYLARGDGEYSIGECYMTVSLGEPYEGHCYKLVAAVLTKERRGS